LIIGKYVKNGFVYESKCRIGGSDKKINRFIQNKFLK